eukprot:11079763-Alexandrium_andersonii.AAC.1
MAHGPWKGAAWFQQLAAGAADFFQRATPKDPLFLKLAPSIMQEVHGADGELDTLSDESLQQ